MRATLEILRHSLICFLSTNRKKAMSNPFLPPRPVKWVSGTNSRVAQTSNTKSPWTWKRAQKAYRDLSRLRTKSTIRKFSSQYRRFHLFSLRVFPAQSTIKKQWAWKRRLTLKLILYKFSLDLIKWRRRICNPSPHSKKNLSKILFKSPKVCRRLCLDKNQCRSPNVI